MSDPGEISNRISEFVGKKINIVLRDSTTRTGEIEGVKRESIILRDMRLKRSVFPLAQVAELYFDKNV